MTWLAWYLIYAAVGFLLFNLPVFLASRGDPVKWPAYLWLVSVQAIMAGFLTFIWWAS